MDRHGVRPHVRWQTEVIEAAWDESSGTGSVRIQNPDGIEETLVARAVISAVGQLNRASIPDFPGREEFAGPSFHSSQWDHNVETRGKRIAVVGAGASGFQIVPTLAPDVAQLTVFQRTAQWMFPNRDLLKSRPMSQSSLLSREPSPAVRCGESRRCGSSRPPPGYRCGTSS